MLSDKEAAFGSPGRCHDSSYQFPAIAEKYFWVLSPLLYLISVALSTLLRLKIINFRSTIRHEIEWFLQCVSIGRFFVVAALSEPCELLLRSAVREQTQGSHVPLQPHPNPRHSFEVGPHLSAADGGDNRDLRVVRHGRLKTTREADVFLADE